MKKINRASVFLLALMVFTSAKANLEAVREFVTNKKMTEAAQLLKKDQARWLKDRNAQKQISKWFSLFLYETSMEVYNQAEEFAETDPSSATDKFKELMEREPYNKTIVSAYITFLLNQKKWSEAKEIIEKGQQETPFFYVFNIYAAQLELLQERPAPRLNCESFYLEEAEKELCYVTLLHVRALEFGSKRKPSESELKKLSSKVKIPEAQYWLWRGTRKEAYLRSYENLCKNLSLKDKKNYRNVPSLCAKMPEVKTLLEPKKNDDKNTP